MTARSGEPIGVVVADDHPLYREGLAGAIRERPRLRLVGEAGDRAAALRLIAEHAPRVALLDVKMPVDGPSVLRRLEADGSATRVVFLSAHLDSAIIYGALKAGAAGFGRSEPTGRRSATRSRSPRWARWCSPRRPRPRWVGRSSSSGAWTAPR